METVSTTIDASTPIGRAQVRLTLAVTRLAQMRLIGLRPTDLRFGVEIGLTIVDVIVARLIERGIFTEAEYEQLVAAAIDNRAELLEQRAQARLDGKKEMPR